MPRRPRQARRRALAFAVLVAGSLLGGAGYVAWAAARTDTGVVASRGAAERPAFVVGRQPLVVFRQLDRRRPGEYGSVAAAPLTRPDGPRLVAGLACERVHMRGGRGICLAPAGRLRLSYRARLLGRDLRVLGEVDVGGVPSRARVSPDGRLGAATTFVSGHSYAEVGAFSTQTILIDMVRGVRIAELEEFTLTHDGQTIRSRDLNYWGVTFSRRPGRFYATAATRGSTYLVEGDVEARTLRVLRENVECPSLSPDETRVAFKKRVGAGTPVWRLHVLELATMRETALAETRVVDDQAEWLDDRRVLYRVDEEVWVVHADGRGAPRRFLRAADSPAVVQ